MKPADLFRLVALSAIWGASFLFFRMGVPSIGVAWFAEFRVAIAAVHARLRAGVGRPPRRAPTLARLPGDGLLNAAVPWTLYAYAGLHLGAGTMSILNATTPFFAAICGALWLGERFTARKLAGLALGVAGVAMVVGLGPIALTRGVVLGSAACIAATLCYALSTTWLKKYDSNVSTIALSTATLVVASIAIAPFLGTVPPAEAFSTQVVVAVLGVSLLCSALGFLLYFRLIATSGRRARDRRQPF